MELTADNDDALALLEEIREYDENECLTDDDDDAGDVDIERLIDETPFDAEELENGYHANSYKDDLEDHEQEQDSGDMDDGLTEDDRIKKQNAKRGGGRGKGKLLDRASSTGMLRRQRLDQRQQALLARSQSENGEMGTAY